LGVPGAGVPGVGVAGGWAEAGKPDRMHAAARVRAPMRAKDFTAPGLPWALPHPEDS